MMKLLKVIGVVAVGGLMAGACSSSGGNQTGTGGSGGKGGSTGSGGSTGTGGRGGTTGTAGAGGGTGGSGGATGTGGAAGMGPPGCVPAGGSGGATGGGGVSGAGGATGGAAGGASGSGGAAGHGGSGGAAGGSGGATGGGGGATGGAGGATGGTGGAAGAGGAAGGASGSGGATGGASGAGGAGGAVGTPPTCTEFASLATGPTSFTVTSPEYTSCSAIPAERTCDAKPFPMGTSPAITWTAGPSGTMSYAVVFKDLSVIARYASTDPNHNKGFHYVIWDIPADKRGLPANMMGGHLSTDIPGARQWSNFNNYGWFGPCPNFDPTMPTTYNDSYAFVVYALPTAKTTIPAQQAGISNVRLLDGVFKAAALATAEYRGTSSAASSGIPAGVLPPTPKPICATDGSPFPCGCLTGP